MESLLNFFGSLLSGAKGDHGLKIGIFVFGLIFLLIINDLTGFTNFISVSKKIEITEKIVQIKRISNDSTLNNQLDAINQNVINHQSVFCRVIPFLSENAQVIKDNKFSKEVVIKHPFLFLLTSAGLFYIIGLFIFLIVYCTKQNMNKSEKFFTTILISSICFILAFMISYVCYKIPATKFIWLDLVINFIIQCLVIKTLTLLGRDKKDNTSTSA